MKRSLYLLIILISSIVSASQSPRMQLWLTGSVFLTLHHECEQNLSKQVLLDLQKKQPLMTEHNVLDLNTNTLTWKLNPDRYKHRRNMFDQCFVMKTEDEIISGIIISVNSARMYHTPYIMIYDDNETVKIVK